MEQKIIESEHLFDLIIIGSGPSALSVITRILESRPAALYTEEEHIHLHWLLKKQNGLHMKLEDDDNNKTGYQINRKLYSKKDSKRPLLKTKYYGKVGNEKILVKTKEDKNDNHCECEGLMKILIIDKFGSWMANWNRLFEIYQISHLRSPLFFHPAPADLDALLAFAEKNGRMNLGEEKQERKRRNGQRCSKNTPSSCPDLIEVTGCVGKEISKHKHKKRRQKSNNSSDTKRMGKIVNERDRRDYFTPSTKLFKDFIQRECIDRYGLENDNKEWQDVNEFILNSNKDLRKPIQFLHGEVIDLNYYADLHIKGWQKMKGFSIELKGGIRLAAKSIVCAGGPSASPRFPDYLKKTQEDGPYNTLPYGKGWCHSTQLGLQGRTLPPKELIKLNKENKHSCLVVIGGGLTSAQICDVAIRSGIKEVILLMRGYFKIKPFDLNLEWIGRYSNLEKMKFWQEDDPEKRLEILLKARNGGSITPRYAKLIKRYEQEGKLNILTCTEIEKVNWISSSEKEGEWELNIVQTIKKGKTKEGNENQEIKQNRKILRSQYIISATGATPSFSQTPFLRNIAKQYPIPEYGGLPWLTDNLQYGKLPLFCTGAFSALQIGPGAFNLEGMRAAADRIAIRLQELAIGQNEDKQDYEDQISTIPIKKTKPSSSSSSFTHFAFEYLPQEVEA